MQQAKQSAGKGAKYSNQTSNLNGKINQEADQADSRKKQTGSMENRKQMRKLCSRQEGRQQACSRQKHSMQTSRIRWRTNQDADRLY